MKSKAFYLVLLDKYVIISNIHTYLVFTKLYVLLKKLIDNLINNTYNSRYLLTYKQCFPTSNITFC